MRKISIKKINKLENMLRISRLVNLEYSPVSIAEKMGFQVPWINELIRQIKKL